MKRAFFNRNGLYSLIVPLVLTIIPLATSCHEDDTPFDDENPETEIPVETPEEDDTNSDTITEKPVILKIRACLGEGSRVSGILDEETRSTSFRWDIGDKMKVYVSDNKPSYFTVAEVSGNTAIFEGELAVQKGENVCAIYAGRHPEETSGSMAEQKGTLEGLGEHLIMISQAEYTEEETLNMTFHHLCSMMTFNLKFPAEVTSVSDITIDNLLTDYTLKYQSIESKTSNPITIDGTFIPDDGLVPVHVVILPGSKFNEITLTCETNDGTYNMPMLASEKETTVGANHRTTRVMEAFEPYEIVTLAENGTATPIQGARHRESNITWSDDAVTAGSYISICNPRAWKCFHTVTEAEAAAKSITIPDINAGCTVDANDIYRNDWITAVYMGSNVSSKVTETSGQPLYFATGNLIAISRGDGTAAFRLATIDEMKNADAFRHSPDNDDISAEGTMWDTFLYGDPTGMAKSSEFKTPNSAIFGTDKDIAHVNLGYNWRLPYIPYSSTLDTVINELYILSDENTVKYEKNNVFVYDNQRLYIPSNGLRVNTEWRYPVEGYMMSGFANSNNGFCYCYIQATDGGVYFSCEKANITGSSALNVRPVTY